MVIKLDLCFCFSQEMYPPKVHQFAYVTDEACTEDEILSMEIIIMKVNGTHITHLSMAHKLVFICYYHMTQSHPTDGVLVDLGM